MVQWLRLQAPDAEGLALIPDQGTRCHIAQLSAHMLQLKIPHAATKTWHSQIKKKERKTINILLEYSTTYMGKNVFSGIPSIKRTDKNDLISFNSLHKFLLKYCCFTVLC